uniref:Lipase domain-containing protein n=1 Tax=Romanomermis culicivorax TaxID=13658 RepID=A0A915L5R9_ROMCU
MGELVQSRPGRQHLVGMLISTKKVKGSIKIKLYDQNTALLWRPPSLSNFVIESMAEVSMCQIPPRLESMPRLNSDVKINDEGYNVMVVKWVNGSNVKDYSKAAANTRSVGTAVANVLDKLIAANKIVLEKTTLMGFSLGAHISGYVGSLFNGTMPRIF